MNVSTDNLNSAKPIPCPRCAKLFRLPDGFTESNKLACPHCHDEVSGKEIADSLVPVAEIVQGSGDGSEVKKVPAAKHAIDDQDFVIPKPLKTATRRRHRSSHPQRRSSSSSSSIGDSQRRSGSSSRKKSSKKPERTAKGEFFRIVLGGLLALPIAQLILWWGFQADPVGLAPVTGKYVPFVLPRKMQPVMEIDDDSTASNRDMPKDQILNDNIVPMNIPQGG